MNPTQTALLVMDFQNTTVSRLPDPAPLLDRVERSVAEARIAGCTIGYVRVGFTEDDWAKVPAANPTFHAAATHKLYADADASTAFHEQLTPREDDVVVRKTRVSALSTTDLDRQLRERGITTLVLAGISTGGVVLATVVEASDRDYELYVLSDGVADPDAEVHDFLLRKIFPKRAKVIDTQQLSGLLLHQ
jgi:nicotinamidase-related amidase